VRQFLANCGQIRFFLVVVRVSLSFLDGHTAGEIRAAWRVLDIVRTLWSASGTGRKKTCRPLDWTGAMVCKALCVFMVFVQAMHGSASVQTAERCLQFSSHLNV